MKRRLLDGDLMALANAPGARKHAIHLVDEDDPERRVGELRLCDADADLGDVLDVIRELATRVLNAEANHRGLVRGAAESTVAKLQAEDAVARYQRWATTGRW